MDLKNIDFIKFYWKNINVLLAIIITECYNYRSWIEFWVRVGFGSLLLL